jgi:hypothetical protein
MKHLKIQGKFSNKKGLVDLQLPVISFIDDNVFMVYCPALDLTGYGNDEGEARASFEIVLEEYLNYTTTKGTLWNDLKRLGWTIKKSKQKPATPPSLSYLLEKNEEFSNIFNNYAFKKFTTGITLPAA